MSRPTKDRTAMPVKAGPKRIVAPGTKRKMKQYGEGKGFEIQQRDIVQAVPPSGTLLRERLNKVDQMERKAGSNSDPFLFKRMRAHVRAGIETFE